ncbi:MAG: hypothetical protein HUU38_31735 [Anaerolineales bacterium]|nr:hypothetical protein [Anaerolineales bacterium]
MLAWQFSLDETQSILIVKTEGTLDIEAATQMRNEGAAMIRQTGVLRCLLDHRALKGDTLSTLDIYGLPQRYKELGISHRFKMAVVVPERFRRNMLFFETVCRNNGYQVSVFFDCGEALAWLLN